MKTSSNTFISKGSNRSQNPTEKAKNNLSQKVADVKGQSSEKSSVILFVAT